MQHTGVVDVTFIANDTRGGIEPYLALAGAAAARGHTVRAVAPPEYAPQFTAHGVTFAALVGVDRAAVTAHGGSVRMREMGRLVSNLAETWAQDAVALAAGTDIVVAGIGGLAVGRPAAQRLGVPFLRAHLQPLDAPSTLYPGALLPRWDANGLVRRLSHHATAAGVRLLTRAPERSARHALGLTARPTPALPVIIYGFSPAVVPVASDPRTRRIATGYWTLPAAQAPFPGLDAFLAGPGPVVSVGFGSMHGQDPVALRDLVVEATRRVGVRTVLISGWGALASDEAARDTVFSIDSVPHARLFPRMSANVHHGGAGTTGASLSAGVPTVVVPFGADQPFWGQRAHQLGVAPPSLPRSTLTADRLARALDTTLQDSRMSQRAAQLGAVLGGESGARTAIDEIEAALNL